MLKTIFKKQSGTGTGKPTKAETNPLLNHGPAGWLINRLQRYAILGWIVAFAVIFLHFFIVTVSVLVPKPVMVVDQGGNLVGQIEYLKTGARSDQEILASSMHYMTLCQSLNSATIYNDMAACMNLQTPELRAITATALKKDNFLRRVEKIKSRSWLEFGTGTTAPAIVSRKGTDFVVRLKGNIFVDMGQKNIDPKPFDVTLTVRSAPRNSQNTTGIAILDSRDN